MQFASFFTMRLSEENNKTNIKQKIKALQIVTLLNCRNNCEK